MTALLPSRPSLSSARCANTGSEKSLCCQRCQQRLRSEPMLARERSVVSRSQPSSKRCLHMPSMQYVRRLHDHCCRPTILFYRLL